MPAKEHNQQLMPTISSDKGASNRCRVTAHIRPSTKVKLSKLAIEMKVSMSKLIGDILEKEIYG